MILTRVEVTNKITTLIAMAGGALLLQSCATNCCKPEKVPAPARSNFVREEIPVPGSEKSYPVWRTRSQGEPVLLLHALNGISAKTLLLALEMETWGYRVYLPSLYGDMIGDESAYGFDMALDMAKRLKKNDDWRLFDPHSPGRILDDVAEISRWVARQEPGRDLTVIGNCLTGNFPLALLDQPAVKTIVVCQPALPAMRKQAVLLHLPQLPHKSLALGIPKEALDRTFAAMRADPEKRIVGFHYHNDPLAPQSRFDALHWKLKRAGLKGQFRAHVLGPEDSHYAAARNWVEGGVTDQKQKLFVPHSTIINPENLQDRKWFRERLRAELK